MSVASNTHVADGGTVRDTKGFGVTYFYRKLLNFTMLRQKSGLKVSNLGLCT